MAIIFCTMLLGRFPWGIAQQENHAFREFCEQSLAKADSKPAREEAGHEDKAKRHPGNVLSDDTDYKILGSEMNGDAGIHSQPVIQQPHLLIRLPAGSRSVIAAMLEINPDLRLTSQMVLQDIWVKQIRYCHEGPIDISEHHRHTLCGR
jgi:serine/threonine protein kinase